ncbi:MAG: hypothetical protein K2X94_01355 [Amoebophilaceae bacterium]|nr:hypothetical protein [Amoebophilaceae bacterium]
MQKIKFIVFSSLLLVFLNALPRSWALGLDFIERTSFNKDGSGLFSLNLDLAKSKKLIKAIKYLNKDYENITKSIGYNAFCGTKQVLKKIAGIDDVRIRHDERMLTITLRFNFKSIQVLNKALSKINQELDPMGITYFSLSDEIFIREDMHGIAKKLIHYHDHDNSLIKSLNLSYFFQHTTYTTIYTFDKEIKNASNPLSEITKDKKTIRVVHQILSADEVEDSIRNRVHFVTH